MGLLPPRGVPRGRYDLILRMGCVVFSQSRTLGEVDAVNSSIVHSNIWKLVMLYTGMIAKLLALTALFGVFGAKCSFEANYFVNLQDGPF